MDSTKKAPAAKSEVKAGGFNLSGLSQFDLLGIAFQLATAVFSAISTGKTKIPAIRTYISGVHVEIGPIAIKRI